MLTFASVFLALACRLNCVTMPFVQAGQTDAGGCLRESVRIVSARQLQAGFMPTHTTFLQVSQTCTLPILKFRYCNSFFSS